MRGVVFLLAWLLPLAMGASLSAQSTINLSGEITDARTLAAVPDAEIILVNTGYRTISDRFGRFQFEHLPIGRYQLAVRSVGYRAETAQPVEVTSGANSFHRISLTPEVYVIPGQRVTAARLAPFGAVTILDHDYIVRSRVSTLTELLSSIDGLYVESDGGGNNDLRVRIRGATPDQVLVLVDGQKLNSAGTGSAAAGSIPVAVIRRVEVHRSGASTRFGPDAMGGAVNVITREFSNQDGRNMQAEIRVGPWHQRRTSVMAENPIPTKGFAYRLAHEATSGDNDFPFNYTVDPEGVRITGQRINNHFESTSWLFAWQCAAGRNLSVDGSLHYYDAGNGLPGRADAQDASAFRGDGRVMAGFDLNAVLPWQIDWKQTAGWSQFTQEYTDTAGAMLSRYHELYESRTFNTRTELGREIGADGRLSVGAELIHDRFDHSDRLRPRYSTGESYRTTWGCFSAVNHLFSLPRVIPIRTLSSDIALRYDASRSWPEDEKPATPISPARYANRQEAFSPKVGFSLSGGDKLIVILRGSVGESYRLPSLNALFWSGDVHAGGNPDLRPERTCHRDLAAEIVWNGDWGQARAATTFYHNDVTDLVVWVEKGQSVWGPVNLGRAEIVGHEDIVTLELWRERITVSGSNSVARPLNKVPGHNSYDKDLTFTPRFVTTLQVRWQWAWGDVSYSYRYVARRYALTGNEKWYEAYCLHNLSAGLSARPMRGLVAGIRWSLNNASNEDYVLIAHHPMPPRQNNIELQLSYRLDRGD